MCMRCSLLVLLNPHGCLVVNGYQGREMTIDVGEDDALTVPLPAFRASAMADDDGLRTPHRPASASAGTPRETGVPNN